MSLLIWLPLNGDTQNKGLGESLITSKNITYTSGKIGNSAYFNNSYITLENTPLITGVENFSISFWFNTTSPSNTQCLYNGRQGVGTAIAIFAIGGVFRFDDGAQHTFSYKIPNNKWEHYAFVRTSSDIKFYVNGVLNQTFVATKFTCDVKYATIGASSTNTSTGSGNIIIGNLNDYRIYDHALSAKEVKEISKGLCIHYQLKGDGAGENLLVNSSEWFSNKISLNNANCTITREINYDEVAPINKVLKVSVTNKVTTDQGNAGIYIIAGNAIGSDWASKLVEGETYTYSFWAKSDSSNTNTFRFRETNIYESQTFVKSSGLEYLTPEWKYCTVTFKWTYTSKLTCCFYIDSIKAGDTLIFYLCGFKLEKGSKATPWTPNPADTLYTQMGYNSIIEPDCSGFGFNGTITGSLPTNINSPRYNTCRTFESNKYIRTDKGFPLGVQPPFTISLWYKPTEATYSTWADVVRCGTKLGEKTALWRMECYNTTGLNYAWYGNGVVNNGGASCSWNAEYNKWHHLVQTFDGTVFRQYVNGTQVSTYTLASAYVGFETTGTFGVGDYGMYGDMSDVRVYATCLTAEDVKELYNTSASIDKRGSLHCYELEELKNTPSIENTGVVSAYSNSEYIHTLTKYGSPTVSNGVWSNFSSSNYLIPFNVLTLGNDFDMFLPFRLGTPQGSRQGIYRGQVGSRFAFLLCCDSGNLIRFNLRSDKTTSNGVGEHVVINNASADIDYVVRLKLKNGVLSYGYYIGGEYILTGTINTDLNMDTIDWFRIGGWGTDFTGSVDVSKFRIYASDTLVHPTNLEKCSLGKIQATANSFIEL